MPCVTECQLHHVNVKAGRSFHYYHLITEIDSRIDQYGSIIHRMMRLVPTIAAERDDVPIEEGLKLYVEHLHLLFPVEEEFNHWKRQ